MSNVWLLRENYGNGELTVDYLLKNKVACLGWYEPSQVHILDLENWDKNEYGDKWSKVYQYRNLLRNYWGKNSLKISSWGYYLASVSKGDYFLIPKNGGFLISKIVDDKIVAVEDNVFGRKIELPFGEDIYSKFSEEITRKFKYRGTFFKLGSMLDIFGTETETAVVENIKIRAEKDCADYVEDVIQSSIDDMAGKLLSKLIDEKSNINPDKFENLIKRYMEKIGATARVLDKRNGGDGIADIDIEAEFNIGIDDEPIKVCIQAKYHTGRTNEIAVKQLEEAINNDGYDRLWVISTADDFTDEAKKLAKDLENIRLINGLEFCKMLIKAGLNTTF